MTINNEVDALKVMGIHPVRFLVAITSLFAAYVYLYLLYLDWTGQLPEEELVNV